MSGTRTIVSKIELLKVKAAIIQPRLRVRILPVDSNVESSNMIRLPDAIQPRRPGGRIALQGAGALVRSARYAGAGAGFKALHPSDEDLSPGARALRSSQSEPLCWDRHHARGNCSQVTEDRALQKRTPRARDDEVVQASIRSYR